MISENVSRFRRSLPPTFALDPFLRQNPLTNSLTLGTLIQRSEQILLLYNVSLLDKPAAGPGDHDGSLLDVDVGRLLGRVRVPVQAKAEAHPTPHCVGWVVLDIALVNQTVWPCVNLFCSQI